MIEVIDKGQPSEQHPVPVLFVHGAEHAAWCWDEHFLDFFADRGYRAIAMSLRGHGGSPTTKPPTALSISDYVNDVVSVAGTLPVCPVVVGHSMGGFVVQKYLESHAAPAAVLVASAPPHGGGGAVFRMGRVLLHNIIFHPFSTLTAFSAGRSLPYLTELERVRSLFFSPLTPESSVARYAARLRQEQIGRAALDMILLDLPKTHRVTTPTLVLGAECDSSVTRREVEATARAYGVRAEIFPDMGHDMMLEPDWHVVAERIDAWLSAPPAG